jgi:AcrR family transcriptional regulator
LPAYKQKAKTRILEAALEEFKEKGYFRTTMDDIAKRLGISHGAIYQYFPRKESLLAMLYSNSPENLRSMLSNKSGNDPFQTFQEIFDNMATKSNANLFVDFLAEAYENSEFQKLMKDIVPKFNEVIESTLTEKYSKSMPREKLRDSAITLSLVFNGLFCWLAAGMPEREVRQHWARSLKVVLR